MLPRTSPHTLDLKQVFPVTSPHTTTTTTTTTDGLHPHYCKSRKTEGVKVVTRHLTCPGKWNDHCITTSITGQHILNTLTHTHTHTYTYTHTHTPCRSACAVKRSPLCRHRTHTQTHLSPPSGTRLVVVWPGCCVETHFMSHTHTHTHTHISPLLRAPVLLLSHMSHTSCRCEVGKMSKNFFYEKCQFDGVHYNCHTYSINFFHFFPFYFYFRLGR